MPPKFYDLDYLQNSAKNLFIVNRDELNEFHYTYDEILKAVRNVLVEFIKIKLPRKVGIGIKLREHTVASCVLLLSVLNYDCFFYPIEYTADSVEQEEVLLNASGVQYLISDYAPAQQQVLLQAELYEIHYYLSVVESSSGNSVALNDIKELCYVIGTTGSTSAPKMVYVPYACIATNVVSLSACLHLTAKDLIFLCAPLTFDPFVIEFFMGLQAGAALLITSSEIRSNPTQLLHVLFPKEASRSGITILQMTPSLLRTFGAASICDSILCKESSLRILLLGGEPFPSIAELQTWLTSPQQADNLNKSIFNIYGITEFSCWCTLYECNLQLLAANKCTRIPLGELIDSTTELRIITAEGTIVESSGQGELLVGSKVRKCFIPQIDGDDANFLNENTALFRSTGDFVERSETADIYYVGRLNNTIKRFGKRICLDSLASKIELLLSELEFQVICLWLEQSSKLICCLKPKKDSDDVKKSRSRDLIMQNLMYYEKPDKLVYLAEMPINKHGKVARKQLENMLSASEHTNKEPVEIFKHFLQEILALNIELFTNNAEQEATPSKRLKNNTDLSFQAAGGTSFHALSLASEIGAVLQNPTDERILLEMFLDNKVKLQQIMAFLQSAHSKDSTQQQQISLTKVQHALRRSLKFLWRINFSKCIDSSPIILANKYVCVGAHSHLLRTIDATSGEVISSITLNDRIECQVTPYVSASLALVGCYDGRLYAFDYMSGKICWHFNVGGMIKAKPLLVAELNCVIVGCYAEDFNLHCICLETQQLRWRCKIGTKPIFSSPVLLSKNSAILVCTLDGSYACVECETGQIKWSQQCTTPIFATAALIHNDESEFIIAEVNGSVHICRSADGVILHTFNASGNIFSSLTTIHTNADSLQILFGSHDHYVYCLHYANGKLKLEWKCCLSAAIYATPIIAEFTKFGKCLLVCSTKGTLAMLDLNAGHLIAKYELKAEIFSTACYLSNEAKIYVGCRDNYLYCFGIE